MIDFTKDFERWLDNARASLAAAISDRDALAMQLTDAEKIEAAYEAEQREIESRVMRAVGVGKTEAGHLRRFVADRRRDIPRPESPRIREHLASIEWKIADLRLTLSQIGDAVLGKDVDAAEAARTRPTPAAEAPLQMPEILDDPGFDVIMPTPTWRAPLSDRPVTDLEVH